MNFGDKVNDLCAKGISVLGKSEKKSVVLQTEE